MFQDSFLAIQETKCTQPKDHSIQCLENYGDKHDYRLIIFEKTGGKTRALALDSW